MLRADARNYHRITEEGLPVMRSRSTTRRSARAGMAVVVLAGGLLLGLDPAETFKFIAGMFGA